MSFKRCSPEPSKTGRMARCSSSISAARRYCRMVDTPPPRRTSRAARCSGRLLQSGVNAFGDKTKLRASRHPERRARVMRQHEDRRVIRRLVAPPALPAVVRPWASDRTEHVAPKNPGPDSGKALLRHAVVDPRFAIVMAVHPPPYARVEEPLHQLGAPDAERILEILVRPGTVAVDGNREALDAEFRHDIPRYLVNATWSRPWPARSAVRCLTCNGF